MTLVSPGQDFTPLPALHIIRDRNNKIPAPTVHCPHHAATIAELYREPRPSLCRHGGPSVPEGYCVHPTGSLRPADPFAGGERPRTVAVARTAVLMTDVHGLNYPTFYPSVSLYLFNTLSCPFTPPQLPFLALGCMHVFSLPSPKISPAHFLSFPFSFPQTSNRKQQQPSDGTHHRVPFCRN